MICKLDAQEVKMEGHYSFKCGVQIVVWPTLKNIIGCNCWDSTYPMAAPHYVASNDPKMGSRKLTKCSFQEDFFEFNTEEMK